jgi:hypothetical protein
VLCVPCCDGATLDIQTHHLLQTQSKSTGRACIVAFISQSCLLRVSPHRTEQGHLTICSPTFCLLMQAPSPGPPGPPGPQALAMYLIRLHVGILSVILKTVTIKSGTWHHHLQAGRFWLGPSPDGRFLLNHPVCGHKRNLHISGARNLRRC